MNHHAHGKTERGLMKHKWCCKKTTRFSNFGLSKKKFQGPTYPLHYAIFGRRGGVISKQFASADGGHRSRVCARETTARPPIDISGN